MINFADILTRFAGRMNLEGLEPDENGCCLLVFPADNIEVQMEVEEPHQDQLLIVTIIGELPVGRFREEMLRAALIANGKPHPNHGTLAFSGNNESLILFGKIPEGSLTGDSLFVFMNSFIKKARVWKEALESNTVPTDVATEAPRPSSGEQPFGLA